ncbi:MAG: hypothetical protein JO246_11530 [Frankiaceae bacterium]|nr:hypothetical protein [Frankiaceae bacterium]
MPGSVAGAAAHHKTPATKAIVIRPVTAAGKAASGFQVKKEKGAIDCKYAGPSIGAVDPDIDECSPAAAYAIACWKAAKAHHTLCTRNPKSHRLYRFPLTSSFKSTAPLKAKQRAPLRLKLTSGTRCDIRIGGAGAVLEVHPKWSATYYCGAHAVWASPHANHYGINEKAASWTVHLGRADGTGRLKIRHIAKGYFVGTA